MSCRQLLPLFSILFRALLEMIAPPTLPCIPLACTSSKYCMPFKFLYTARLPCWKWLPFVFGGPDNFPCWKLQPTQLNPPVVPRWCVLFSRIISISNLSSIWYCPSNSPRPQSMSSWVIHVLRCWRE